MYLFVIWGNAMPKYLNAVSNLVKRCAKLIDLKLKYDSSCESLSTHKILLPEFLMQYELCKLVYKQIYFDNNSFDNFILPSNDELIRTRNGKYLKLKTKYEMKNPKDLAKQAWISLPDIFKLFDSKRCLKKDLLLYFLNEQDEFLANPDENICYMSCIDSVIARADVQPH